MESTNLKRIPLEVVEIILSELGVSDLLNCRLVDRDWNQECLRQLRRSKARKYVNVSNINSVLEFMERSAPNCFAGGPWVLPFEFRLNHEEECHSPSLQLTSLLSQAPGSVHDVVIDNFYSQTENTFRTWVQVLRKCSPHLKKLVIYLRQGPPPRVSMSLAVSILKNENLTFPNLTKLHYFCPWTDIPTHTPPVVAEETLVHVLIQQSPNLEQLKCLSGVRFDQMTTPPLHKLKKLQVRHRWTDSYDLTKSIPAPHLIPRLDSLHLEPRRRQFEEEPQTQTFRTILSSSFSARLKFLTIDNFPTCQSVVGDTVVATVTPINFPVLPCLTHLRIGLKYNTRVPINTTNLKDFNFSQATFPALKSVDIEFGFYWGMPEAGVAKISPIETFSSVERLKLRVKAFKTYSQKLSQDYVTHVQEVFPNVNQFSLVSGDVRNLRPILEAVFGSLRAPQIHTFEYMDFDKYNAWNALSKGPSWQEVESEFVLPISNMKSVTKFCVQSLYNCIHEDDLRWFAEQFPSLTQIDLLTPPPLSWTIRANRAEFLQVLEKFPSLAIKQDRHEYNWYDV